MKIIILTLTLLFSLSALADGKKGKHYHPKKILNCAGECTESQVREIAPNALSMLIKSKQIDSSWAALPLEKIEQKQFKKGREWVLTLNDPNQKEVTKQKLYVFITLDGWLNGSNHTGN